MGGRRPDDERTIKQEANLYDTTIVALQYYEDVGLFSARRDEANGYRIYGGEDFAHLNLFRTLREMEIPLSEIKRYEASHGPHTSIDILSFELNNISGALAKLEVRRDAVLLTLTRYSRALIDAPSEELRLLSLPARPHISVEEKLGG